TSAASHAARVRRCGASPCSERSVSGRLLHPVTEPCLRRVQIDRDEGGEAGLLHGDAVEDVSRFHGLTVVSDDQELGLAGQFPENTEKTMDVRVVERGVDLVQHAEGTRPEIEDRKEERQPGERTLAAR